MTFVLVVSALIAMILDIFKYYLDCFHEKRRSNRETTCRRDQMIGFGGVLLCGIVPQLVLLTITFHVSAITILSFKKFFLETPIYYVKSVKYGNRKITLITFSVIYIIALIAILKSGIFTFRYEFTSLLFFGISSFTAIVELLMVFLEPFEMRTEQETAQIIEKFKEPVEVPPTPGSEMDQSFNDIFMYFYSILVVVFVVLASIAGYWSSILSIILIGSIFIWFMKKTERDLDEDREKKKMNELEFCTYRLKFGFFGILSTWCMGQWPLYVMSFEFKNMIELILTYLIVALSIYYYFIQGYRDYCNLNYQKFKSTIIKTVVFLIFIGMIVIRISISFENRYQNFQMGCIQFILFFMPLGALPDFLVVMRGGVYLVGVEEQAPQPAATAEIRKVSPEMKCQECQEKYSEESRIPRILKECGHTVCEPCADQRLEENRGSYLYCPVCRMATVVMGAASLLKRNWAALEIMADN
ncbi:unnamed protein product [Caenorhabditis brenneri]